MPATASRQLSLKKINLSGAKKITTGTGALFESEFTKNFQFTQNFQPISRR
jgi:hypothetical protein